MTSKNESPYFFNFASPTPFILPNSPNVLGRTLAKSISTVSGNIIYGGTPSCEASCLRCCRKCSNKPPEPDRGTSERDIDADFFVLREGTMTSCRISSTSLCPANTSSAPAVTDKMGYFPVELRK